MTHDGHVSAEAGRPWGVAGHLHICTSRRRVGLRTPQEITSPIEEEWGRWASFAARARRGDPSRSLSWLGLRCCLSTLGQGQATYGSQWKRIKTKRPALRGVWTWRGSCMSSIGGFLPETVESVERSSTASQRAAPGRWWQTEAMYTYYFS